jgi:AraC family transcriptional regulator
MLDAQTAWPVDDDVTGAGRIEPKSLPAARALVFTHIGPYEELSRSYRLLAEVMERNGLESAGPPREIYVTDPDEVADPNEYETRIVWPIGAEGELDETADVFTRAAPS